MDTVPGAAGGRVRRVPGNAIAPTRCRDVESLFPSTRLPDEAPDQMKKHVCSTKRSILEFVLALILTGSAVLGAAAPGETEEKAPPGSTSTAAPPSAPGETEQKAPPDRMSTAATPQTVLVPLQRTFAWYQGA